jgi:hypothetical protein
VIHDYTARKIHRISSPSPPPLSPPLSNMPPRKGSTTVEREIVRRPARARSSTPLPSPASTTKRVIERTRVAIQGKGSRLVQSTPKPSVYLVPQKNAPDQEDDEHYTIQEPGLLEDDLTEGRPETVRTARKTQERRRKKYKVRYYDICNTSTDSTHRRRRACSRGSTPATSIWTNCIVMTPSPSRATSEIPSVPPAVQTTQGSPRIDVHRALKV